MPSGFVQSLFEHKAWCNQRLLGAMRAASARQTEPRAWLEALFTFDHIVRVDELFKTRLAGTQPTHRSSVANAMPDLEEIAGRMAAVDAWYIEYASTLSPSELTRIVEFDFADDGARGRMSRGDILGHIITHGASHRGAISKMLERIGVAGAPDMMTTFRADVGS
jgi:uncharacterized damage-inducible protein DinB